MRTKPDTKIRPNLQNLRSEFDAETSALRSVAGISEAVFNLTVLVLKGSVNLLSSSEDRHILLWLFIC